jgi:hypothetical protein
MKQEEKNLEEISASVVRYYDSLTDDEAADDRAWGEFAATQFAVEEFSDEWQGGTPRAIGKENSET